MGSRVVYQTVREWFEQIRNHIPLGKWQALNLALLSFGIVAARSCTLSLVAEKLWAIGKADSIERRLQRFLNNKRVVVQQCTAAWTRWVLTNLRPCPSPIVLLVDETKLADHLSIMVVALAYRKRAIPLAWRCYHQQAWPCSQLELITSLLKQVAEGVSQGVVPLVQADRGIGTSPELVKAIQAMGWRYLLRVQGQCRFWEDGTEQKEAKALKAMTHRGGRYSGQGRVFKKAAKDQDKDKEKGHAGWLRCYVHVKWPARFEEPWCLITNCSYIGANGYGVRVWEEEGFRDLKSGGWQWQRSRVWKPEHAERLMLAMAVAYAFVLSMGTSAIRGGKQVMRQITRGHRHQFSVFRLGLRYLSRILSTHPTSTLPFTLCLVPEHPLC